MTHTLRGSTSFYWRMLIGMAVVGLLMVMMAARPAHATTTFTVNTTADSADGDLADNTCDAEFSNTPFCTLRAAIQQANATPGADTIEFAIPTTGVATIHVNLEGNGSLPYITDPVTINGYTQPGASPNTLSKGTNAKLMIQLDGTAIPGKAGLYLSAPDVVVKGLLINRFGAGIFVLDAASNARIEGDFLGTDPSGTLYRSNTIGVGMYDNYGPTNNTVGGSTLAARNLISGNDEGVTINSDGNRVANNLIGTQRDAKSPLGNRVGVHIISDDSDSSSQNIIGGEDPGYANTIAFNRERGVVLNFYTQTSNAILGNSILSNSIFSNGILGIDLGIDGITPNDAGDADFGPNSLQNKPVLSSAKKNATGETVVNGQLNSTPNTVFTIQFFKNPPGTNEGKTFLGSKSVNTDGTGNVSFTFSTTKKVKLGQNITATATNTSFGDTSEFSAPKKVVAS